jgi:formylglycine-generating enzyme required for sulfatase activity/GTPase SAR1 family protein
MTEDEYASNLEKLHQAQEGLDKVRSYIGEEAYAEAYQKIQREIFRLIQTQGGSIVEGDLNTNGGDYVGRDKYNLTINTNTDSHVVAGSGNVIIYNNPHHPKNVHLVRYLESFNRVCLALPLAAMGGDEGADEDVTLDHVYIELDTTEPAAEIDIEEEDDRKKYSDEKPLKQEHYVSVLEASCKTSRLTLLGDPGAGKSTFVRRLASWLAASKLYRVKPPLGYPSDLLPIIITLRDLTPRLTTMADFDQFSRAKQEHQLIETIQYTLQTDLQMLDIPEFFDELLGYLNTGRCLLVLDGLDEVQQKIRARVRQAISVLISRYHPERVIVTCRTRSYIGSTELPGFSPYTLRPFDPDKIQKFITLWYHTQQNLGRFNKQQAEERIQKLSQAALSTDLSELAANPMLLTTMAIIHQREVNLPSERVRLYKLAVEVLLRRWQRYKIGDLVPSPALAELLSNDLKLLAILERLAYEAHRVSAQQKHSVDLPRITALLILESPEYLNSLDLSHELLDYIDLRAGLLLGRGGTQDRPETYGFPHRTFQEYLAGSYLMGQRDLKRDLFTHAAEGDVWDLAALLGFEDLYYNRRGTNTLIDLAYQICPTCRPDTHQRQRAILWSGQIAALVGKEVIGRDEGDPNGGNAFLDRLRQLLISILGGNLPPAKRVDAGIALAQIDDPRQEVITIEGMLLCFVSGGACAIGVDRKDTKIYDDAAPKSDVKISDFWISYFPITQAQFAYFVKSEGYATENYWKEAKEAGYWENGAFQGSQNNEPRCSPAFYGSTYELPNHPVVGISWYEALAFTRWLQAYACSKGWLANDWQFDLPSEVEWEKTVRGGFEIPTKPIIKPLHGLVNCISATVLSYRRKQDIDSVFPWGDEFDPDKANTSETFINKTNPVGCFPSGVTPYGAMEMIGNVWEWTRSIFKNYPYDPTDGREDLDKQSSRVLRGGSWLYDQSFARTTYRYSYVPNNFSKNIGFRVVIRKKNDADNML